MKMINYLNRLITKAIILVVLLLVGLIFRGNYVVSNVYFISGMILLLIAIISILFNAHLFNGWKLNGNRKNSEFVEGVENNPEQSKSERIKEIAAQKNEPMKISSFTRLVLAYALILIISGVLVSFF
jgi:hypothetical protein